MERVAAKRKKKNLGNISDNFEAEHVSPPSRHTYSIGLLTLLRDRSASGNVAVP
jgi:hypothetical protein